MFALPVVTHAEETRKVGARQNESSDYANRGVDACNLFRSDHGRITECLSKFNVGLIAMSQETVFHVLGG